MLQLKAWSRSIRPVLQQSTLGRAMFAPMAPATSTTVEFTRGKRTKRKALAPGAQRVVTMLSVFSAHKKQPRRLKLSMEDLIRHNTVQKAWSIFMRDKKTARTAVLREQYEKMEEACDELQKLDPYLAFEATKREKGKRFSPEMRIPTETPPNEVWAENWKVTDIYEKKK